MIETVADLRKLLNEEILTFESFRNATEQRIRELEVKAGDKVVRFRRVLEVAEPEQAGLVAKSSSRGTAFRRTKCRMCESCVRGHRRKCEKPGGECPCSCNDLDFAKWSAMMKRGIQEGRVQI
jgi:hypothetical protein